MRIKLSGVISDLWGLSGRGILTALAQGQTDPVKLAELGGERLQCGREMLIDALRGSITPVQCQILKLHLEMLDKIDSVIESLDQLLAEDLKKHEEAVIRLAEVPGLGVDSAQRLIAEVGVDAEAFDSADEFASWFGGCPGSNVSAEENHGSRSPKGNRYVRKLSDPSRAGRGEEERVHFPVAIPPLSAQTHLSRSHLGHRTSNRAVGVANSPSG